MIAVSTAIDVTERKTIRLLSAKEILSLLHETMVVQYVGRVLNIAAMSAKTSSGALAILDAQATLRGFAAKMVGHAIEVSVVPSGDEVTLSVPDGWEERVDLALGNSVCERCGSLVVRSLSPHSARECDAAVVTEIMET